jgi:DNA-binding HxlR family transcriptional regulator
MRSGNRRPRSGASGGRKGRSKARTLTISNLQDLEAHWDELQGLLGSPQPERPPAAENLAKTEKRLDKWLDRIEGRRRLGIGGFVLPGTVDRFLARHLFFRAICRDARDVVEDLRRLLPICRALDTELAKLWGSNRVQRDEARWERWQPLVAATKTRRRLRPLVDELRKWASAHGLSEDWGLDAALWNLDRWTHNPQWLEQPLRWRYPGVVVAMNTGLRQGNQFHLRWTEVNFDTGMITVKRSKSRPTTFP